MAVLVLGPLLRYIGETEATIWVEADRPCRVEVLGHAARTFEVAGHHYALVVVTGLRPGSEHAYQVTLDGTVRWPLPDPGFGPSVLRTLDPGGPRRLAFGSCRVAELPPPRRPRRAGRERDHGSDALDALANGLAGRPRESWPDSLLLIGDQVYADEPGPATREFIGEHRDPREPPGYEVADFEEYCALYREAWSAPAVRWLLSVVPTIMIFDDHDVHDDWNTSGAWRREFRAKPWWPARIAGAFMSYWLYQHLGNLSPAELGEDDVWRQVQEGDDAALVLRDLAVRADARAGGIRWSVRRDFGAVRVVVIDSRSRRVVDDDRRRLMVDEAEWQWVIESSSAGGFDHLVLATSLPLLLPRGIHSLEAWNEAVCAGAWGNRLRSAAERLRQAVDLEHWAAFGASFRAFETLLVDLASGSAGRPASITIISGDIHHHYLAAVSLPPGPPSGTTVYQAVCSPLHNLLPEKLRFGHRLATSGFGALITTAAARLARVPAPRIRWRVTDGPWFANMLAELRYDGRQARIRFDRTVPDGSGIPALDPACEVELTPAGDRPVTRRDLPRRVFELGRLMPAIAPLGPAASAGFRWRM
jgi:hypothetical protein